MAQETEFHEVGFKSVDTLAKIDTDDCYFIVNVTFGDGNTGQLLYPYRINGTSNEVVIDTGPQSAYIKVPISNNEGQDGYRKQSIGLTSDVPSHIRSKISDLVLESNQTERLRKTHNIRELKFKF